MAIKAITGLQGSGKTYETVLRVVVPAIKEGRRVVTNISGLQPASIAAFLDLDDHERVAKLIHVVTQQRISEPDFFPVLTSDGSRWDDSVPSVVVPGDVIIIDEAWHSFGDSFEQKKLPRHFAFLREHRHYVSAAGHTCDIHFLTQDINDLHRTVRRVVELTTYAKKPKELGITNAYIVDLYRGYRLLSRSLISTHRYFYDERVFTMYSSYTGNNAKELALDDRQNVLKKLIPTALAMLFLIAVLGYYLWNFFHPEEVKAESLHASQSSTSPVQITTPSQSPWPVPDQSDWRVVGRVSADSDYFLLVSGSRYRYVARSDNSFVSNHAMNVLVDGKMATTYANADQKNTGLPK